MISSCGVVWCVFFAVCMTVLLEERSLRNEYGDENTVLGPVAVVCVVGFDLVWLCCVVLCFVLCCVVLCCDLFPLLLSFSLFLLCCY